MDLISVIMPFYRKKPYFSQSLESVINQSYTNFEIIIVYDQKVYERCHKRSFEKLPRIHIN